MAPPITVDIMAFLLDRKAIAREDEQQAQLMKLRLSPYMSKA
jgi:hypothetical protein